MQLLCALQQPNRRLRRHAAFGHRLLDDARRRLNSALHFATDAGTAFAQQLIVEIVVGGRQSRVQFAGAPKKNLSEWWRREHSRSGNVQCLCLRAKGIGQLVAQLIRQH